MNRSMLLYEKALKALLADGTIARTDRVVVFCGGSLDARLLAHIGMSNVVITNLDERYDGYCAPFEWQHVDAENASLADESFDWAIVHMGLHHCASPHRAFLEMARVARKGAIAFEARDSMLMRFAIRLKLVPNYEIYAVALEGGQTGGLRNGPVPNFIYRWTEREVVKMLESAGPGRVNDVRFFYGLRLPDDRLRMSNWIVRVAYGIARPIASLIFRLAPRQGNEFAFALVKTPAEKPWMRDGHINSNYESGFDPLKYRSDAPPMAGKDVSEEY
jgi:SAM-dependent methyltransferase